ncbi:hypothetical protein [Carboxylicivirga sp. M1479]|uniref:hypothetical protein n=1 Tax=Carboxylicivirga sp. M1479 TaxID=2594476 RepID=UPI0011787CC7|nr:hypothetical protein [Carboxylicivirga sp. M1479]TRX61020.1 hypothetical protein FNN09_20520 [Carboxylicivirga sp. M1479]
MDNKKKQFTVECEELRKKFNRNLPSEKSKPSQGLFSNTIAMAQLTTKRCNYVSNFLKNEIHDLSLRKEHILSENKEDKELSVELQKMLDDLVNEISVKAIS